MHDRNKNELNHGDEVYFYASLRHEWMMGFVRKINFDKNEAMIDNGPKDNPDLRENGASYSAWVAPAELIKIFPKTQATDVDAVEVTPPVEQTLAEVEKETLVEAVAEVATEVAVENHQAESKPRPRPEWPRPQEKNSEKSERGYRPRESRD